MRSVLTLAHSCWGVVQHQSSHILSLTIESIFIKDVCYCTLIKADKSLLKVEAISAWRGPSFTASSRIIRQLNFKKLRLRQRRWMWAQPSAVRTKTGQGRVFWLMNMHLSRPHIWTNYNKSFWNSSREKIHYKLVIWASLIKHVEPEISGSALCGL